MKNKFFSMFDYLLILVVLTLVALGVMFIYSSSINSAGERVTNEYIKQIIWASIGLVIMIAITIYDYRRTESLSMYGFIGLRILLIYTRIFGRYVNGAKSWIGIGEFGIQPSEFGKVFYILYLARILDDTVNENQLKRFFLATGVLLLPMGLILLQPDLGTASVYLPIYFIMCFIIARPQRIRHTAEQLIPYGQPRKEAFPGEHDHNGLPAHKGPDLLQTLRFRRCGDHGTRNHRKRRDKGILHQQLYVPQTRHATDYGGCHKSETYAHNSGGRQGQHHENVRLRNSCNGLQRRQQQQRHRRFLLWN